MRETKNLCTKKLTEFTTEDTIYIKDKKDIMQPLYLCEFISYNYKNNSVTGKIIRHSSDGRNNYREGQIITAKCENCALYGSADADDIRGGYFRWFDSSLYAIHPLEKHKVFEGGLHVPIHPSYGLARFTRGNSSRGIPLFGSSIQNKHTITFEIFRAEHKRDLSNDWFQPKEDLIKIEMSQNQFAELITNMNHGVGLPVTIRHINLEYYPEPPFIGKADLFKGEFENKMHNYSVNMKKGLEKTIDILSNKTTIGKGDRELILNEISSVFSTLENGIPFTNSQFIEAIEKTVTEAKSEIEAFVENKIRSAGLEALGFNRADNTPLIDNND
jgi:hypothetical protein